MNEKSAVLIDELGLWQTDVKCPDCGAPLHYKPNQDIAFCWQCAVNHETARRGRDLLLRISRLESMQMIAPQKWYSVLQFGTSL